MITSIEQLLKIYNVKTEEELDWEIVSQDFPLSEKFIEKYSDKVDWYWISEYQKLSEAFIKKHADKLDWYWISEYQKLSEAFIKKHADKLNWSCISINQTLSKTFLLKYWERIPVLSLQKNCGNHNRTIFRFKKSPEIIHIGCFKGTQEQVIKVIQEKYQSDPVVMQQYIDKVKECFNTTLID